MMSATIINLSLSLAMLAIIFGGLGLVVRKSSAIASWRAALPETRTNLLFWFADGLLIAPIISAPAIWLGGQVPHPVLPPANPVLLIVAGVIFGDFVGYWRHRLQHTRWLWPAHSVHHSDRHVGWLTLVRMHPLDRLSTVTIDGLALTLAGLPWYVVVANSVVRSWYGHFIHADLPWHFGRGSLIAISPCAHRWHHSRDLPGTNFATLLSVWDRAFGTYCGRRTQPAELGIEDEPLNFLGELARPIQLSQYWAKPREHVDRRSLHDKVIERGVRA